MKGNQIFSGKKKWENLDMIDNRGQPSRQRVTVNYAPQKSEHN